MSKRCLSSLRSSKLAVCFALMVCLVSVFTWHDRVAALSIVLSGPTQASVGDTITVVMSFSEKHAFESGFDVNVNYDAAGLAFLGASSLACRGCTVSVPSAGQGNPLIFGYFGSDTTKGLFSLRFRVKAAGTWAVSTGEAAYGPGYASPGSYQVTAAAPAKPPRATPTPTPLPVVGPTPIATRVPIPKLTKATTGAVPPVTMSDSSLPPTEASSSQASGGFFTFEGKPLRTVAADIPSDRIDLDYKVEVLTVNGVEVKTLYAPHRPRLYWLQDDTNQASLYVQWQSEDRFIPYGVIAPITERFVIVPPPSDAVLPPGFTLTSFVYQGKTYPAYVPSDKTYQGLTKAPLTPFYVVYARLMAPVPTAPPSASDASSEASSSTPPTTETTPIATTAEVTATTPDGQTVDVNAWRQGEFYVYDPTRGLLYPLALMITPATTPTPTPTLVPTPTIAPTSPPTRGEPSVSLLGRRYDLWRVLSALLAGLLVLTWISLLIRSIMRHKGDDPDDHDDTPPPPVTPHDPPPSIATKPETPHVVLTPTRPQHDIKVAPEEMKTETKVPTVSDDKKAPAESEPSVDDRASVSPARVRYRHSDLPAMPPLSAPRPRPLPHTTNTTREHAADLKTPAFTPLLPLEPEASVETVAPPTSPPPPPAPPALARTPRVRRVDLDTSLKAKRRPPEIIDDNGEI